MRFLFIIFLTFFFSNSNVVYAKNSNEFEFFGYTINGEFSKTSENFLGVKSEWKRDDDEERRLQYIKLKPLLDLDGLKAHSNVGRVWEDKFLIYLSTKFVEEINQELVPFKTMEECILRLEVLKKSLEENYGWKFRKFAQDYRISGRFLAEGDLRCDKTSKAEIYKSKGFKLIVNVLGSKFFLADFEYKKRREQSSEDKITPFGLEFGAINPNNFDRLIPLKKLIPPNSDEKKIEEDKRTKRFKVYNPRYPLTFFEGGEYSIKTFDNDIWKISAKKEFQEFEEMNDLAPIAKTLFKNYGRFIINTRSFRDEKRYGVESFSELKELLQDLKKGKHVFLNLWNLVLDNRYHINIGAYYSSYDKAYTLYLDYTNIFYASKRAMLLQEIEDSKDNLEEAL